METSNQPLPALLIPAFKPGPGLHSLVQVAAQNGFNQIVVVDDGSGPQFQPIFSAIAEIPGVRILRHPVNLGKGAALRYGFLHCLNEHHNGRGVVTADADGQHEIDDILAVARSLILHPNELILGVRQFGGKEVPKRSQLGNQLTRLIYLAIIGQLLTDTQTGLRGVPNTLLPKLLALKGSRYEFELEMLVTSRQLGIAIREVLIRTVYLEQNASSHFNPILDSGRIYFVLLRFGLVSALTWLIDTGVFFLAYRFGAGLFASTAIGRFFAGCFNFTVNKKLVFHSGGRPAWEVGKYVGLVCLLMIISYRLVDWMMGSLGFSVIVAKLTSETLLFLLSFSVQRLFVFSGGGDGSYRRAPASAPTEATNWDQYYLKPFKTASITRKITTRVLIDQFRRHLGTEPIKLLELGGGNSCFFEPVMQAVQPAEYLIVDNNPVGLEKFTQRFPAKPNVRLINADVIAGVQLEGAGQDCVFSVGLIEHFDPVGTSQAIKTHFDCVKPGGLVIITFPTPTWLYRTTRRCIEAVGLWAFPDERPLGIDEVVGEMRQHGSVLDSFINWPIFLTHGVVIARKN